MLYMCRGGSWVRINQKYIKWKSPMEGKKIKVLHLITTIQGGGAETQLIQMIEQHWSDVVHQVVALGPAGAIKERYAIAGVELHCLDISKGIGGFLNGLGQLTGIIRKSSPSILQTWMYHADLLGLLASATFPSLRVLWYLQCSNIDFSQYSWTSSAVFRACRTVSNWPTAIAANSHSGAACHKKMGYPTSKMQVVANGFLTDYFKPNPVARKEVRARLKLNPEDLLIAHVGRFDPMKNHALLFEAAAISAKLNPKLHFIMIGNGVDANNPACAAAFRMPLAGRCHLVGEQQNIPWWLSGVDAHVNCSISEGVCNAVGESMAVGIPNLVTDVGDNSHLVGDTGWVVPSGDSQALSMAILHFAGLEQIEIAAKGNAARQRIKDHYSMKALCESFRRIYSQII
jgi:glycosyltransferase involved in cell wall biosynthesis